MDPRRELLSLVDVLVDGPFLTGTAHFCRYHLMVPRNQQIIDATKSLSSGDVRFHGIKRRAVYGNTPIS